MTSRFVLRVEYSCLADTRARLARETRRALAFVCTASAVTALTTTALARGFALEWKAPPGCPQHDAVLERVASLVSAAVLSDSSLSAHGRIEATPGGFRLTLESHLGDSHGTRTIEATQCDELAGAASVTLGLLLRGAVEQEPTSATPTSTPSSSNSLPSNSSPSNSLPNTTTTDVSTTTPPTSQPQVTQITSDTPSASPGATSPNVASASPTPTSSNTSAAQSQANDSRDAPAETPSPHWLVLAPALALELGPIPRAQWGLAAGLGVQWDKWRVAAAGQAPFTTELPIGELADTRVEITTKQLAVDACYGASLRAVELWPCLGGSVEHLSARGVGPAVQSSTATAYWFAPEIGLVARWMFWKHGALVLDAFAKLEGGRPKLVITGLGEVQRWSRLGLNLKLGTEWIF